MFVDVLPRWERCTYWIVGVSSMAYSIYNVFLEGNKYKNIMTNASFSPGWNWIGRDIDHSDYEWSAWLILLPRAVILKIIHVLLSQICFYFKVSVKLHTFVLLVFDLTAAYVYFGIRAVVLQIIMALMMYAVSLLGSTSLVWMLTVAMISTLNFHVIYETEIKYLKFVHWIEYYNFYVMSAFFFCRLLSFAIEKIRYNKRKTAQTEVKKLISHFGHNEDNEGLKLCDSSCEMKVESSCEIKDKFISDACKKWKDGSENSDLANLTRNTSVHVVDCDPSFIDLLFYSFYLPTYLDGPIFQYSDFHTQVKHAFRSSDFSPDLCDIVKKLVRIAFWAIFIEFQFHFLYFKAFGLYPTLIDILPIWAVAGIVYYQCQFFTVKYIVFYGTAIQLSRFDGIIPLAAPRCISWVVSYTELRKHFDVGLHNFVKTYIYVPLGGSKAGLLRQIFATSISFIFLFYWYDASVKIFVWSVGNYLIVCLEATTITLEQTVSGIKMKSYLGQAMWIRLKAFLLAPVHIASFMHAMFLFFEFETGWAIVRRMVTQASWTTLITEWIVFTVCIHNAIYLLQWYNYKRKERREKAN